MKRLLPLALLIALVAAAPAEARTVRSHTVIAPTGACMTSSLGGGIACFGEAVPSNLLDGYLHLKRRGRTHRAEAGGMLTPSTDRPVKLRRGDRWNKRGVRCRKIRGGIKCSNGRHGFKLKKRGYRVW